MYKRIHNIKSKDAEQDTKTDYKHHKFSKENGYPLPLSNDEYRESWAEPFGKYTGDHCEDDESKLVEHRGVTSTWHTFYEIFDGE